MSDKDVAAKIASYGAKLALRNNNPICSMSATFRKKEKACKVDGEDSSPRLSGGS